jgi:hypothetical protein
MTKRLEAAEREARMAVDEWIAAAAACAAQPWASAATMFDVDQKMLARIAQAYEVAPPQVATTWSACSLAWTRSSIEVALGFTSWMMPWAASDVRALALERVTERFGDATITAFRARSNLT